MPERHETVLVRWHCAKVKGHAELKIEKSRVKTLSYDFPKLHHSKTNSFCANVHLRQSFWKTVKVTKRSCDVTPRLKYQKSKGHPWSPCASNLVQFRLLFTKLRHFEKNGTRHFPLIDRHLESSLPGSFTSQSLRPKMRRFITKRCITFQIPAPDSSIQIPNIHFCFIENQPETSYN